MHELREACDTDEAVAATLRETFRFLSGVKGDLPSLEPLDRLLSQQAYRLAHWKLGSEEINYRRFFDINDLVRLRVELPEAFQMAHQKVFELVRKGKITGLRVDHVDGLFDPAGYLCRLQSFLGG